MVEYIVYFMAFVGVTMTLYFWYKEATTDYLYADDNEDEV